MLEAATTTLALGDMDTMPPGPSLEPPCPPMNLPLKFEFESPRLPNVNPAETEPDAAPFQPNWRPPVAKSLTCPESSQAVHVVASHGVIVARFHIAFVSGEFPLRGCAGEIPGFAEGEMTLLAQEVAAGVRGQANREMILVVVSHAGINGGD